MRTFSDSGDRSQKTTVEQLADRVYGALKLCGQVVITNSTKNDLGHFLDIAKATDSNTHYVMNSDGTYKVTITEPSEYDILQDAMNTYGGEHM